MNAIRIRFASTALALVILFGGVAWAEEEDDEYISCTLSFEEESWSFLIEKGKGQGVVKCDNGEQADVVIKIDAGGITFGKQKITNGTGSFAYVKDIQDVFGRYEGSGAGVAAGGTAAAAGLLKAGSEVKLGLYGTGKGGVSISRSWGVVMIEPKEKE